jgi:hypothetical protein
MDTYYSKNKIVPQSIELEKVNWFKMASSKDAILHLTGVFQFDLYHEADKNLWLKYFEVLKQKTVLGTGAVGMGDEAFAAREAWVKNKIQNYDPNSVFYRQIPIDMVESPIAHFYNEIVGEMKLKKNYIYPLLRDKGYFAPLSIFTDELFLKVDETSYQVEITEIPYEYSMKKIFRVKFNMTFDIGKYIEYMIVTKMAKFKLDIFPVFRFRVLYFQNFPTFLNLDKTNFFNWLNNHMLDIMRRNPKILKYCFEKTKVRLDLVQRLHIKTDPFSKEFIVTTDDYLNFVIQLVKGQVNFGSGYSYFTIQQIDKNLINTRRNELKSNFFAFIMFFLIYRNVYQGKLFKRTLTSEQYVNEVYKLIKSGMVLKLLGF